MAPLATPNSVRTAESFIVMVAVLDSPSSVLTALRLIAPDAGNAIYILFGNIYKITRV
jgi:hypothetical protein